MNGGTKTTHQGQGGGQNEGASEGPRQGSWDVCPAFQVPELN